MQLHTKLVIAFSMVAAIPLVGGAVGLYAHYDASRRADLALATARTGREVMNLAQSAQTRFRAQVQEWKNILLRGHEQGAFDQHRTAFVRDGEETQAAFAKLEILAPKLGFDAASITAAKSEHATLGRKYTEALTQFKVGVPSSSQQVDQLVRGLDRSLATRMDRLTEAVAKHTDAVIERETDALDEHGKVLRLLMAIGTALGVIMGGAFGWFTSTAVARHIRAIGGRMWDRTVEVAAAAGQVAGSSDSAATTCAEQARALERSGAVLQGVSRAVKQNATHAQTAREISNANRTAADASAAEVAELQTAMQDMGAASANIAKIVQSIDAIAFQTNILALNAAVEAARAGEAGAGFAVVAEEVRSLAQRSAQAARETASKIEDATAKSTRGVEIAARVNDSLARVIENTRKVDELIGRITDASSEQARGIEEVVVSTQQIDRLTQTSASHAEQTAAAARELDGQGRQLKEELSLLLGDRSRQGGQAEPSATARGQLAETNAREAAVLAA